MVAPGAYSKRFVAAKGLIRRWPSRGEPLACCRVIGEVRVEQMRAPKEADVGTPAGEHGVHITRGGDAAARHRRDTGVEANTLGERHLIQATVGRLGLRDRLAARDVDD